MRDSDARITCLVTLFSSLKFDHLSFIKFSSSPAYAVLGMSTWSALLVSRFRS